jgi:hypothetical protein
MATIPDAADIANALEDLAAGLRLSADPSLDGVYWLCELREGNAVAGYGLGLTMREAAADAWVGVQNVSTLLDAVIGGKALPLPDGRWTFVLGPPGAWERTFAVHTTTTRT